MFYKAGINALIKEIKAGTGFRASLAKVVIAMLFTGIVAICIMELVS